MADDLDEVLAYLGRGRLVLCAGGRLAGQASHGDLVAGLFVSLKEPEEIGRRDVLTSRPLVAAGHVRRRLGDRLPAALATAVRRSQLPPSRALGLLARLPFRAVLTTGYGPAIEQAFGEGGMPAPVVTPADVATEGWLPRERFVFMALGDDERPATVLFSDPDVREAVAAGGYRRLLDELLSTRSLLFVGFEPGDTDLLLLLERILDGRVGRERFAILPGLGALEREELLATHGIRVLVETDAATLAARLERGLAAGRGGRRLPDDDDLEGWLLLRAEDPDSSEAVAGIGRLAQRLLRAGDDERLVEVYLSWLEVEPDPARRQSIFAALARLFETRLDDPARALTTLLAAHHEQPDRALWGELERLAGERNEWQPLVDELTWAAPRLPRADRAEAWARVGVLLGERLDRCDGALSAFEQVQALVPAYPGLGALRASALRRAARWPALLAELGWLLTGEPSAPKRAELHLEIGTVKEQHLGQLEEAIASYVRAIEVHPSTDGALAALEVACRRRGGPRDFVRVLGDLMPRLPVAVQAAPRRRLAAILEYELHDRAGALAELETVRVERPADPDVLAEIERLLTAEGRLPDALEVLASRIATCVDLREKARLQRRLAAVYEESLHDRARAAAILEDTLGESGPDEDVHRWLERLYRADGRWEDLLRACRRHAVTVSGPARAAVLATMASIYDTRLSDPRRAVEHLEMAVSLLSEPTSVIETLVELYVRIGEAEKAVALLLEQADRATVPERRADWLTWAAVHLAVSLADPGRAESVLGRALDASPGHIGALEILVRVQAGTSRLPGTARRIQAALRKAPARTERARLLALLGRAREAVGDPVGAELSYREALDLAPEQPLAIRRLADLLTQAGRPDEALPLLESAARTADSLEQRLARYLRLGAAARAAGQPRRMLAAFDAALGIDPDRVEAQRGRGEALLLSGDAAAARTVLTRLLDARGLGPAARVEVLALVATCSLKLGDRADARRRVEEALAADPTHRPSLLVRLELDERRPGTLVAVKRAFLATATRAERVELLEEIGEICLEGLEDPPAAVAAWRDGLAIDPDNRALLNRVLGVLVEHKAWREALGTLERLVALEGTPAVRARYRYAAAAICRDHTANVDQAVRHFEAALEDDPAMTRAHEALERLLAGTDRWPALADHLARRLERLGPAADDGRDRERVELWSTLAAIHLDRTGDRASGVAALAAAAHLDPSDLERRDRLAALRLEGGPADVELAIEDQQRLLEQDRGRVASYRLLALAYERAGEQDKARACRDVLAALVGRLPPRPEGGSAPVRQVFDSESWRLVVHPDEDSALTALFHLVEPAVAPAPPAPVLAAAITRHHRVRDDDQHPLARAVRRAASVLGVAVPELYVDPEGELAPAMVFRPDHARLQPALVAGRSVLDERATLPSLLFDLARPLSSLLPGRAAHILCRDTAGLASLIDAVIALAVARREGRPPSDDAAGALARILADKLPAPAVDRLARIGARLLERGTRGHAAALAWLRAIDLTAARVGLAVCGDLGTAVARLRTEPTPVAALAPSERVQQLLWSSVTEQMFSVRARLGTLVGQASAEAAVQ